MTAWTRRGIATRPLEIPPGFPSGSVGARLGPRRPRSGRPVSRQGLKARRVPADPKGMGMLKRKAKSANTVVGLDIDPGHLAAAEVRVNGTLTVTRSAVAPL